MLSAFQSIDSEIRSRSCQLQTWVGAGLRPAPTRHLAFFKAYPPKVLVARYLRIDLLAHELEKERSELRKT